MKSQNYVGRTAFAINDFKVVHTLGTNLKKTLGNHLKIPGFSLPMQRRCGQSGYPLRVFWTNTAFFLRYALERKS